MFEKIIRQYNEELNQLYEKHPVDVNSYIQAKRYSKDKLNGSNTNILTSVKALIQNAKSIKTNELLKRLQKDLINYMLANKLYIQHVTVLSPYDLSGFLQPTENTTIYGEQKKKFLFGSATEISKLGYAGRCLNHGMIALSKNSVLFPSAKNFVISDKIRLKKPVYCYYLNPSEFIPVVSVAVFNNKPTIMFDDEWVAEKPQEIIANKVEKITDITPLCIYKQVYALNSNKFDNLSIDEIKTIFNDKEKLQKMIDKQLVLDINQCSSKKMVRSV